MADRANVEPRYPVRAVIARTGLSADVLRAWERRYGAVAPQRSPGGQRLYSEEDVARLVLLRRASQAGHSIGEVARLDVAALEALLDDAIRPPTTAPTAEAVEALVAGCLAAAARLDAVALEAALKRAVLAFGGTALVDDVLPRFLRRVGDRWHEGAIGPAHEHLASATVRRVLAWLTDMYVVPPRAPRLLVATPAGELHEFGAMLAAAAAAEEGWEVVYLGASLPAGQVAAAAAQVGARAVALSAVHDEGAAALEEVRAVARALPLGVALLVGGAAAERAGGRLHAAGARLLPDLPALRRALRALRAAGGAAAGAPIAVVR